jgi:ribosomal protein S18 acetylase RimI-like enzyme
MNRKLNDHVEDVCLSTWPALTDIFYDGWILRLANGLTQRTNSVNILSQGSRPLGEKVAHCEDFYRRQGMSALFRLRSDADPLLDQFLSARGYRTGDESRTLFFDFSDKPLQDTAHRIELSFGRPDATWLRNNAMLAGFDLKDTRTLGLALEKLALPVAFAMATNPDGKPVSFAYGAVHHGIVAFHAVRTDPAHRREGYSESCMIAILNWARQEIGAKAACLQVVAENWPAIKLYRKLGFGTELYRYHYQVLP